MTKRPGIMGQLEWARVRPQAPLCGRDWPSLEVARGHAEAGWVIADRRGAHAHVCSVGQTDGGLSRGGAALGTASAREAPVPWVRQRSACRLYAVRCSVRFYTTCGMLTARQCVMLDEIVLPKSVTNATAVNGPGEGRARCLPVGGGDSTALTSSGALPDRWGQLQVGAGGFRS